MSYVFVADFFCDEVLGGGELNNDEFVKIVRERGFEVKKINSHLVTEKFIQEHRQDRFVVANFVNLSQDCIEALYDKDYVIYEHDHKYLSTRDPGVFEGFIAPKEAIVNYEFYRRARAVLCQSTFHHDIVKSNLGLDNIINLSGNLWSMGALGLIKRLAGAPKQDKCAVMNSRIGHKNTTDAKRYCLLKKLPFSLIEAGSYHEFLTALGSHSRFVFFPKTPETLSRVVVEARMMGLSTITNNHVGATREPWYQLKGEELIEKVEQMRTTIPKAVMGAFK